MSQPNQRTIDAIKELDEGTYIEWNPVWLDGDGIERFFFRNVEVTRKKFKELTSQ